METATPRTISVALSPLAAPLDIHVREGQKIFVNIAWDPGVPPPPPGSDEMIRRAMQGLDIDDSSPKAWFVPVVLSDARQDSDKAGKSAIVFDCVFNPSVKSRSLRDPEFSNFIIELAFQRIEEQTTLVLSRQISTPNIASKGKLRPRRVVVPASLYPPGHPNHQAPTALIQEIPGPSTGAQAQAPPKAIHKAIPETRIPAWSCTQEGSSIRIVFGVPGVTHAIIPDSTLDIEPRRVLLHIPALYDLDLDLDASDSELLEAFGKTEATNEAVRLKRMRSLDVDNARAEWRIADKAIVLLA